MGDSADTKGLTLLDVTKSFGSTEVLRGVSLRVAPGEVTALVGPNGAGKTTLLRIAAGIASPSGGRIVVDGHDLSSAAMKAKARVGFVGDRPVSYGALTAQENLAFFAGLYGIDPAAAREKATAALKQFGLAHRAHDRVSTFSHGMAQRLSLGRALLHAPSVLLLDEPFEGLDAQGQGDLIALIKGGKERATLLASHQLDLCLEAADHIGFLVDGQLKSIVASSSTTPSELSRQARELRGK